MIAEITTDTMIANIITFISFFAVLAMGKHIRFRLNSNMTKNIALREHPNASKKRGKNPDYSRVSSFIFAGMLP